jgi:hypothetical protein
MKCAVEMGSGSMIYIPSLMKTGAGNQKLLGVDKHAETQTAR